MRCSFCRRYITKPSALSGGLPVGPVCAVRLGLADALGVNDKRFRIHPYVKDQIGGMVKVRLTPGPTA